ncbi:hypothetical protein AWV80_35345 [Cupriavidus sp. UYMU48A]|nr:hypothetical protein AWV80_35345 [Cupriavidus sp. UYMU48A]
MWACADTRITDSIMGARVLLDEAPKIFALGVTTLGWDKIRFDFSPAAHTTVGLAYSGSMLVGTNLFGILSPLFSNLQHVVSKRPLNFSDQLPSMQSLAQMAVKVLEALVKTWALQDSVPPKIEAAIFGWCWVNHRIEVYHMRSQAGSANVSLTCLPLPDDGSVFLLGDHKDNIRGKIDVDEPGCQSSPWNTAGARCLQSARLSDRTS